MFSSTWQAAIGYRVFRAVFSDIIYHKLVKNIICIKLLCKHDFFGALLRLTDKEGDL